MYIYIYLCDDRPPSCSRPQSFFALFAFALRFVFAADTVLWVCDPSPFRDGIDKVDDGAKGGRGRRLINAKDWSENCLDVRRPRRHRPLQAEAVRIPLRHNGDVLGDGDAASRPERTGEGPAEGLF